MSPPLPSCPGRALLAAMPWSCAVPGKAALHPEHSPAFSISCTYHTGAAHTRMWGSAASAGQEFVLLFLFGFFTSVIILTQCVISVLCTLLLLVIIKIRP